MIGYATLNTLHLHSSIVDVFLDLALCGIVLNAYLIHTLNHFNMKIKPYKPLTPRQRLNREKKFDKWWRATKVEEPNKTI
jgi:hypothetical protein